VGEAVWSGGYALLEGGKFAEEKRERKGEKYRRRWMEKRVRGSWTTGKGGGITKRFKVLMHRESPVDRQKKNQRGEKEKKKKKKKKKKGWARRLEIN